jgi:hypothetical protein
MNDEGRRKKEEGRRKKEEGSSSRVQVEGSEDVDLATLNFERLADAR